MTKKSQKNTLSKHVSYPNELQNPIDYRSLMTILQEFSDRFPFIGITYMGTSVLGRGIPMVTLGECADRKKSILYVGCPHGTDWMTSEILLRFIYDYAVAYENRSAICNVNIRKLSSARCIYIIPQFNVDGADLQINGADGCILKDRLIAMNGSEDFSSWAANARGVDLDHNYDSGFGIYKQKSVAEGIFGGGPSLYAGEAPESEPEVASMCSFLQYSRDIRMVMSLQMGSNEIYTSPNSTHIPKSYSVAKLLSRMTGYCLCSSKGVDSCGSLTDWVISELTRPSFTLKCGTDTTLSESESSEARYFQLREALLTAPLLI